MVVNGNTSPVVFDGNGTDVVDLNDDGAGETCHCFVDGVINDFADEVVESARTGVPNVHSRTLADVFLIAEMFKVFCGVILVCTRQSPRRNGKLFCRFGHKGYYSIDGRIGKERETAIASPEYANRAAIARLQFTHKRRALVPVQVSLYDANGILVMQATFEWFVLVNDNC